MNQYLIERYNPVAECHHLMNTTAVVGKDFFVLIEKAEIVATEMRLKSISYKCSVHTGQHRSSAPGSTYPSINFGKRQSSNRQMENMRTIFKNVLIFLNKNDGQGN